MSFGLSAVMSLMGGKAFNTPAAIFDGVIAVSSTLSGASTNIKGRSLKSGITAATVGMVSAYTNSDFNAYTSYVNRCYAEPEEPVAEISALAPTVRNVANVVKIMERGTDEQKKKIEDEQQLLKGLQEARLDFLSFYYPYAEEQIESVAKFYFDPIVPKESEEGGSKKVSASAADGFVETEFGKEMAEEIKKQTLKYAGFNMKPVLAALQSKGVEVGGTKSCELVDYLAKSDKFVECTDSKNEQLAELPPGAVVVWASDESHPLGFCSVALGGGRESSDRERKQFTQFSASYRLFLPA